MSQASLQSLLTSNLAIDACNHPCGHSQAASHHSPPDTAAHSPGITQPLLRLSGACAGTELRMASDSMPFGPVVLGSRTLKRVTLENTGDLGTKFEWDKQALGEHFSISPATGFLVSAVGVCLSRYAGEEPAVDRTGPAIGYQTGSCGRWAYVCWMA
eukprot:scaffold247460_cov19-Tisochrysis_lutea.AAC.1